MVRSPAPGGAESASSVSLLARGGPQGGQAQLEHPSSPGSGEGVAGNGASFAPATSNPRLAREDNGCLIFSIRRAQGRILSFTRGGASEVISQRHSARTLLLCGGARTPASARISAAGGAAAATSKGPRLRLWEPRARGPGQGPARPRTPRPGMRARAVSTPHHTPAFIGGLRCFFSSESRSQRAEQGRRDWSEGDGSLTPALTSAQAADGPTYSSARCPGAQARALTAPGQPASSEIWGSGLTLGPPRDSREPEAPLPPHPSLTSASPLDPRCKDSWAVQQMAQSESLAWGPRNPP